jgi:peptidyl-prolyl cis-trans isomerase A (cyclophilin A)
MPIRTCSAERQHRDDRAWSILSAGHITQLVMNALRFGPNLLRLYCLSLLLLDADAFAAQELTPQPRPLSSASASAAPAGVSHAATTRVRIETDLGNIVAELDANAAPKTTENFLRYVEKRFFDGGSFFRTVTLSNQVDDLVKIEVIQAGANPAHEKEYFPPIALERTRATGLRHLDGTLSMARDGPDTAQDSFFICVGDQPELDFGGKRNPDGQGFAAFGRVVEGMEIVRKIQILPANSQQLSPPLRIQRVVRIGR